MRVRLATRDVLASRVVVSPLSQLLVPLFGAGHPRAARVFPWLGTARHAVLEGTVVLRALLQATPAAVAVGLLIPPLPHPRPSLAEQVDALARLPGHLVARALDAAALGPDSRATTPPPAYGIDTAMLATTLAREVDRVWRASVAADWPQLRPALHDETSRLAGDLLQLGLGPTLSRKLPEVQITVAGAPDAPDRQDLPGLLLVPVVGGPGTTISRSPEGPTLVHYPTAASQPSLDAAPGVFGRTRARLLSRLDTPRSTSTLAAQLELSTGTVSYHLQRLYRSGLLERIRDGHQVLYRLNARGRYLLDRPTVG